MTNLNIDPETRKSIIEIQSTLTKIANKQPVFFNITVYQNMGLVKPRNEYYINSAGNREVKKTNWILTDKAKQILNVQI